MPISRKSLRADVHREPPDLILHGPLRPGQHIKGTELPLRLGTSWIPGREALPRQEWEGVISSQLRRGFPVKHLCEAEIRDAYPLVACSEAPFSTRFPIHPPRKSSPRRRIELNESWHSALISESGNQQLFHILDDRKRLLFRYERAFMQVAQRASGSLAEPAAIVTAMERCLRSEAVRLLDTRWRRSMKSLLHTFFARGGQP